ncbi:MAG TPA: hypothetical protein VGG39_19355 [Polyangiaceae bacterium]
MRSTLLLLAGLALAAACGGKTSGARGAEDGDSGTGASDGAADGNGGGSVDATASSSGGSSDASRGSDSASGGSSGASSSGIGTEAGNTCKPLPGCSSTTTCPSTDGCNTCTCEDGVWECTGYACPDGSLNENCPQGATNHSPCDPTTQGECTIPLDPGSACATWQCRCTSASVFYCTAIDCADAATSPPAYDCPSPQPTEASACPLDGALCAYGTCIKDAQEPSTNCLCVNGAWTCSEVTGCVADQ